MIPAKSLRLGLGPVPKLMVYGNKSWSVRASLAHEKPRPKV